MIPKPKSYNWKEHTNPEFRSKLRNSRTVPDMNYSVREILNKFTTGQPINGMVAYNDYDGEYLNHQSEQPDFNGFMPHPKTLDLVDRQHLAKVSKERIQEISKKDADRVLATKKAQEKDQALIKELTSKINILENPAGGSKKE